MKLKQTLSHGAAQPRRARIALNIPQPDSPEQSPDRERERLAEKMRPPSRAAADGDKRSGSQSRAGYPCSVAAAALAPPFETPTSAGRSTRSPMV